MCLNKNNNKNMLDATIYEIFGYTFVCLPN